MQLVLTDSDMLLGMNALTAIGMFGFDPTHKVLARVKCIHAAMRYCVQQVYSLCSTRQCLYSTDNLLQYGSTYLQASPAWQALQISPQSADQSAALALATAGLACPLRTKCSSPQFILEKAVKDN